MTLAVGVLSLGHHRAADGALRRAPRAARRPRADGRAGLLLLSRVGGTRGYFPRCSSRSLLLGLGAGIGVHAAADDRDGRRAARDAGLASGIVNVSMQISGALGLAVLGTISTDHTRSLVADGHALPERSPAAISSRS